MCWAERFSAKLNPKAWTEIPQPLYYNRVRWLRKDISRNFFHGIICLINYICILFSSFHRFSLAKMMVDAVSVATLTMGTEKVKLGVHSPRASSRERTRQGAFWMSSYRSQQIIKDSLSFTFALKTTRKRESLKTVLRGKYTLNGVVDQSFQKSVLFDWVNGRKLLNMRSVLKVSVFAVLFEQ